MKPPPDYAALFRLAARFARLSVPPEAGDRAELARVVNACRLVHLWPLACQALWRACRDLEWRDDARLDPELIRAAGEARWDLRLVRRDEEAA